METGPFLPWFHPGLTLIEAATGFREQPESRLEHLAVIKTFSEGELLARLPFMNITGGGLFYSVEKELPTIALQQQGDGFAAPRPGWLQGCILRGGQPLL